MTEKNRLFDDAEGWLRLLRAGLYIVTAPRAGQDMAKQFADEVADVIIDAGRRIYVIGVAKKIAGTHFTNLFHHLMLLAVANKEALMDAVRKAATDAVEEDIEESLGASMYAAGVEKDKVVS